MTARLANRLTFETLLPHLRRWAVPAALAAITVLAFVVRVVDVAGNPHGFFTDEAAEGYNAYTILHSGKDEFGGRLPLLFKSFGDYKLPVFVYTQVPLVAFFGLTEFTVRLTSVIYGTLTVVTTYLLANALFRNRGLGLAAAFFLAIMPWHIHYSRIGFDIAPFPFFLTLGLYLFLLGTRRPALLLAAGAVLGLALYTYRAAWTTVPPLVAVLALLYYRELLANWRYALGGLAVLALLALPILNHLVYGEGDRSTSVGITSLDLGPWETFERFASQYRTYFTLWFLFEKGDNYFVTRHYLPGYGHLYWVQLPLLVVGTLALLWRPSREKALVALLLAGYPLGGALSTESPFSSRTYQATVVFAVLTALGLLVAVTLLRRVRRPAGPALAGLLVAGVLALALYNFAGYLDRYHNEYPKVSADFWGWQDGPQEIIKRFVAEQDSYDQLIMDGAFNAPEEFFKFYAPKGCQKCMIGGLDRYDPQQKQLFALRPENMSDEFQYEVKETLHYPNGDPSFVIFEIGVRSVADLQADPAWGADGRALEGVEGPPGLALGPDGNLYLVDGDGEVLVFDQQGQPLRAWPSGLSEPTDIAVDAGGSVYVSDAATGVRQFAPDGRLLREIQTNLGTTRGIDASADGTLFAVNTTSSGLTGQRPDGSLTFEVVSPAAPDGPTFLQPTDSAVAADGTVFGVTAEQPSVWKLGPDGAYLDHWSFGPNITVNGPHLAWQDGLLFASDPEAGRVLGYDQDGRLVTSARLAGPGGQRGRPVAVDAAEGLLWTADIQTGRVYRFIIALLPQP